MPVKEEEEEGVKQSEIISQDITLYLESFAHGHRVPLLSYMSHACQVGSCYM